jgi:hypothetical protein
MSGKKTDWKSKYYELRSRHINAMDVSFRLGFQEGLKAAELQNMQMQLQQTQQAAAAGMAGGGGMPPEAMGGEMPPEAMAGAPEGEAMPPEAMGESPEEAANEEDAAEEEPEGDELDSSINELEQLVSKNEKIDFSKMLKTLHKSGSNKKNISELSEKHNVIDKIFKKWDN